MLGGAFVTIWPAGGEPEVIDGNVEMPGRGLPVERLGTGLREIATSYGGGITLYAGHGSVATPGAFAALGMAHERHGSARWADVLAPAVAATRDGYAIGAAAASYLAITGDSVFGWDEHTAPLVKHPDGSTPAPGERSPTPTSRTPSSTWANGVPPTSTPASWRPDRRRLRSAGWAGHDGRPRGIPRSGPHPAADAARRLGRGHQPAPVGLAGRCSR